MAKESGGESTENGNGKKETSLGELLAQCIGKASGLTVTVQSTDDPVPIGGAEVRDVKDGGAWIAFKADDYCLRTASIADRERLLAWVKENGSRPASEVGSLSATFIKVFGQLPKPVPVIDATQGVLIGFHSRARARATVHSRVD